MKKYQLIQLSWFEMTHKLLGDVTSTTVCNAANIQSAIDMIVKDNLISDENFAELTKQQPDWNCEQINTNDVYITSVSSILSAYADGFIEKTTKFLNNANIIAAFGVDADETDNYIIIEIEE